MGGTAGKQRRGTLMRSRLLRRFAAVSTIVTIVDLGVLALARDAGWSVAIADTAAVAVASLVSWLMHQFVTLADDPYVRWVRRPSTYVATASLAGGVDIVVTTALATVVPLAIAKAAALLIAGGVRFVACRTALLTDLRRDLRRRRDQPPPFGERRLTVVLPAFKAADRVAASVAAV